MRTTLVVLIFAALLLGTAIGANQHKEQQHQQQNGGGQFKENVFVWVFHHTISLLGDGLSKVFSIIKAYSDAYNECVRSDAKRLYDPVMEIVSVLSKSAGFEKGPVVPGLHPLGPGVHHKEKLNLASAVVKLSSFMQSEPIPLLLPSAPEYAPDQYALVVYPEPLPVPPQSAPQSSLVELVQPTDTPSSFASVLSDILTFIISSVVIQLNKEVKLSTEDVSPALSLIAILVAITICGFAISILAQHQIQKWDEAHQIRCEQSSLEVEDKRSHKWNQELLQSMLERSAMGSEDKRSRDVEAMAQERLSEMRERSLMAAEDKHSHGVEQIMRYRQEIRETRKMAAEDARSRRVEAAARSQQELRDAENVRRAVVIIQTIWRKLQAQDTLTRLKIQREDANELRKLQHEVQHERQHAKAPAEQCAIEHAELHTKQCAEQRADQAHLNAALLCQTLWRRTQAEAVLARAKVQRMTRTQRTIARKIHKREAAHSVHLREVPVSDDGNCLFYALSLCVSGTTNSHRQIRKQICDWLETNPEYEMAEGLPLFLSASEDWSDFVRTMRRDKEYGTLACLYAASELFAATFYVITTQKDDLYMVPKTTPAQSVYCLSFSGNHYNPVIYNKSEKRSVFVPVTLPSDMSECRFCTRWYDHELSACPRCGTQKL